MTYSAGLDVSLEETAICVVDATGMIVKEMRAESEPRALDDGLRRLGLPLERVGMEACSLAAWLHDGLTPAGWPAVCIETRRGGAAMKTMPNKTDRNDARALLWGAGSPQPRTMAQIMRTGWFRQVHVKSPQSRRWPLAPGRPADRTESPAQHRECGPRDHREDGIKLGTPGRKDFAAAVREMAGNEPELMAMLEPLLAVLATMLEQRTRLTRQVLDIVRDNHICRQLMTSPLRGLLTASLPGIGSKASWPSMASVRSSGADLSCDDRPAGPVRPFARRRCASRPHADTLSVRRDGYHGQDQPLRRRARPHGIAMLMARFVSCCAGVPALGRKAPRSGTIRRLIGCCLDPVQCAIEGACHVDPGRA